MNQNNMYKKYFFISLTFNLVVLVIFLFFTFLLPGIQAEKKNNGNGKRVPLTNEQQLAIDSLNSYYNALEQPLRTQNIETRLKLWKLLMEEFPDTALLNTTMQQLKNGENELKDIRYQHYLKDKYILNQSQRIEKLQPVYDRLKKYLNSTAD